ncbi:MAG: nitroreductase family protein [Thermoplasmatota archaeon]
MSAPFRELVKRNRSYRRFREDRTVTRDELIGLLELARFSASGANKQPLKFLLSWEKETNDMIFPKLHWAGYLEDWDGPEEGERPSAYIIILLDKEVSSNSFQDQGIAAQTMLLGATEKGLGGCMIASIDRPELKAALSIPDRFDILLAVAIGEPIENVVVEDAAEDIRYYRDEEGTHHVPKRKLSDLVVDFR